MVNDTSGHDIDSWLAIDVAETDKVFHILNMYNNTFIIMSDIGLNIGRACSCSKHG